MSETDLLELRDRLRKFAAERHWERYHDPKNLSMALAVEAAELMELFQWLTPEESRAAMSEVARAEAVADELADILIYLVRIADVLDVDLRQAALAKIVRNEDRFPRNDLS
jgi:NTP pyrophosphatase (non-canonical NTP hydrolase)